MDNADLSAAELMEQRVHALYVHDTSGRLTGLNQWDGGQAPRFYFGSTPEGHIVRFGANLPKPLADMLIALCKSEPLVQDLETLPAHQVRYLELLDMEDAWSGPAYRFRALPSAQPSNVVSINDNNAHLLNGGLEDWLPDVKHRQPFYAAIDDDHAVAVCASVRITDTAHEAGVETLLQYRHRGHAIRAVTAWANAVAARGAIPLYSTSWSNTASLGVARALKLEHFGNDFHVA